MRQVDEMVSARMSQADRLRLRLLARRDDISVSEVLRRLVRREAARHATTEPPIEEE